MRTPLYQVDAFTDQPFCGNPAAVCLLNAPRESTWMQDVAREMNLSETAFLIPHSESNHYDLRWFTPTAEVDLCGHATLASAHILWEVGRVAAHDAVTFHTKSGPLVTQLHDEGWIAMDFPAEPAHEATIPDALPQALHVTPGFVGQNRLDYLVLLDSEEEVRTLQPDVALLERVGMRGVMVTAPSDSNAYDFVSRYFAPNFGIPEDPVTGSAHCCLGPFWRQRLDKADLVGYQASKRGGMVRVRVLDDRVHLMGQAVTVLSGELTMDD